MCLSTRFGGEGEVDLESGSALETTRGPEVSLNELLYVFGTPLGAGGPVAPPINYTKTEAALSESVITTWTNFIKTGNPNEGGVGGEGGNPREKYKYKSQDWANYDPQYRRYLEFGSRGRVRDHYRAGRVALWSWLVPGLERVGARYGPDSPFHRLPDHQRPDTFSGPTRPTNLSSNLLPPPDHAAAAAHHPRARLIPAPRHTPRPPALWALTAAAAWRGCWRAWGWASGSRSRTPSRARRLPYTTALSLTVAIGCSLLILNCSVRRPSTTAATRPRPRGPQQASVGPRGRRGHGGRRHRYGWHGRGRHRRAAALARRRLQALVPVPLRDAALVRHAALVAGHVVRRRPARVAARLHHVLPGRPTSAQGGGQAAPSSRPPHNGTATLRAVPRPPPPPRSSSYPSHVEAQPLLSPSALLHANNAQCSEMRV
nr:neuroligin 4-like [Penaeus vannamei]